MSHFIDWIRRNPWQSATAGLSIALVAVVAVYVLDALASDVETLTEEAGASPTISTTSSSITSTVSPDSTTPDEPEPLSAAGGPFGEDSAGPVTAVVVDNVPDVGLQVGLDGAALLMETPVEGSLSRFIALFGEDVPDLVGPVRSLRPVNADLLAPFTPVIFTTGGQPHVTGAVEATGATVITPEVSIAFQSLERPQPYHIFVSPGVEARQGFEVAAAWVFGDWPGGVPVAEVTVPIDGGVTWRFENDVYVRYRDDQPHEVLADLESDPAPLTRDVLILLVAHQKSAGYTDSAGAEVSTFDVVGAGDLYVLHAGQMITGRWSRTNQADGYIFADGNGNVLPIPPGALYLAVVPDHLAIDIGG